MLNDKSRMKGDLHVRFREKFEVKVLLLTRLRGRRLITASYSIVPANEAVRQSPQEGSAHRDGESRFCRRGRSGTDWMRKDPPGPRAREVPTDAKPAEAPGAVSGNSAEGQSFSGTPGSADREADPIPVPGAEECGAESG